MGAPRNRRSSGNYWSSTTSSTTSSRSLSFNSANLGPSYGYNKGDGFAVRQKLQIFTQSKNSSLKLKL
ncbi:hypothetical protein IJH29_02005 [Candidatus Saccharibacteria bacterium]|nr:hypothetical protein [Candidatus Saccharibacteria bacterium]